VTGTNVDVPAFGFIIGVDELDGRDEELSSLCKSFGYVCVRLHLGNGFELTV
jgi:hypothetical protein